MDNEEIFEKDGIDRLKAAILTKLYEEKVKCIEYDEYIKTEIVDFYPRENGCSVVTNSTLDLTYSKEYKFNKITQETRPEKISDLAELIVNKTLDLNIGDLLRE